MAGSQLGAALRLPGAAVFWPLLPVSAPIHTCFPHPQVGLKYFDDLQERIPRAEVARAEALVREVCLRLVGEWPGWAGRRRGAGVGCGECYSCRRSATDSCLLALTPAAERHGATDSERTFCFATGSYR